MAEAQSAGRPDSGPGQEIMRLLEHALKPVEPPATFVDQLEQKLASVEAAAIEALEELSDWELEAMRDPRNWVRPVVAVAVGTTSDEAAVSGVVTVLTIAAGDDTLATLAAAGAVRT